MLHEFVIAHRDKLIDRCRTKIATRAAPRATEAELRYGVPLFLDQLVETLRHTISANPDIAASAVKHGEELLRGGFTIVQLVHDYGDICQSIMELAIETDAPITSREFQTLNLCLDDATAQAVGEFSRLREHEGTERMGRLAHELRNLLNGAILSFEVLKSSRVGVDGSTGAVLRRSLRGLGQLIDRELAQVRLGAGVYNMEPVVVCELIEDTQAIALMDAKARGLQFSVGSLPRDVVVRADRQILASVIANLLQNAFKYTRPESLVALRAVASDERVRIEVADHCGGLPPGRAEELFGPFQQRSGDRSGLGLGLDICHRGVAVNGGQLRVENRPGQGCTFVVDLPRHRG